MKTFIDRVEEILERKSISKTELSEVLNIRRPTLSEWKKNGAFPAADIALKIAKYLNVSVEWLITGEETNSNAIPLEKETIKEILQKVQELLDFIKEKVKE